MHLSVPTNPRSSMNATTVATASRTRTKPSVTRTHCMFVVTVGPALHCPATIVPFMSPPTDLARPMSAVTAVMNLLALVPLPVLGLSVEVFFPSALPTRTGRSAFATCKKCTSLESATHPRSFTAPTTSASTSNTATLAPVASGQTCSRMHVSWTRILRSRQAETKANR